MKHSNSEKLVKAIHRKARRKYSAQEKIRIVLEGLRGEESIADTVSSRRVKPERLLPLEQGVSGSWKTTFSREYQTGSDLR